jgi:hypothetical protein
VRGELIEGFLVEDNRADRWNATFQHDLLKFAGVLDPLSFCLLDQMILDRETGVRLMMASGKLYVELHAGVQVFVSAANPLRRAADELIQCMFLRSALG